MRDLAAKASARARRTLAAALAALAGLGFVAATDVRSQDEGSESGKNKVHFPIADEVPGQLEGAARAAKEGECDRAVDLVRAVLDRDNDPNRPNRIVPVEDAGAPAATSTDPPLRRWKGVSERAFEVLRAFPKEARDAFRKKFDGKAKALFAALEPDASPSDLLKIYDRFPIATCAAKVLETAADRSFERGEIERSRRLYERLLRFHKDELASPPLVREKLVLACVQLGRRADVDRLLDAISGEDPAARVHLNGSAVSRTDLVAMTLKCASAARGDDAEAKPQLLLPRGDATNRAAYARPVRIGAVRFRPKEFERLGGDFGFRERTEESRFLPIVADSPLGPSIFVATADKLRAYSFEGVERPRISWIGKPYEDGNDKVLFGTAVDRGVLLVPYVEDIQQPQEFRNIPIKVVIPRRKIGGFDLERWRWKWDLKDVLAGSKLERASFPAPPICEDGAVFVSAFAIEGFVHCYAASFDSQTGALGWYTWIASGQVEQTMFGEHAREPLCASVACGDGTVYDVTQMGCVAAMDADTGRLKWVTEYDQIEVHSAKGYFPDPRNLKWANNPPILSDGVLIAAPMDSEYFYGFDASTGKQLWRKKLNVGSSDFDQTGELKYLVGASDGKVVLAGGRRVYCCDVRTGRKAWDVTLERAGRLVSGRGIIAADKVLVPATDAIEIYDLKTGTREGSTPVVLSGNLALAGDSLVVASESLVTALKNDPADKPKPRNKEF